MSLFSSTNLVAGPCVRFDPSEFWSNCGDIATLTGNCATSYERKTALIKNQIRKYRPQYQTVKGDFRVIQKAPQGARLC
jgi:hypothetical protein